MTPINAQRGRVTSSFGAALEVASGVLTEVEEGETVKGVFGGTITVWVLLHPLTSPEKT